MIGGVRDVPLSEDPASRYLPWTVGLLVFLATLALAVTLVLSAASDLWRQSLSGTLTVQIPPPVDGSDGEARVDAALELLRQTPGISSAVRLSDEQIATLLEPWLGRQPESIDLPMPALIDVSVETGSVVDVGALSVRLTQVAPGASIDDHAAWLRRLSDFASVAVAVSLVVIGVILASAVSTVIFTTRTGLAIHRDIIELLHLIGAHDAYVARQFQSYAMRLSIFGALIGFTLAAAAVYALGEFGGRISGALLPDFTLAPVQWAYLAGVPVGATALVVITVGITVTRTLRKMM
jgi:cell division transport system permease protein